MFGWSLPGPLAAEDDPNLRLRILPVGDPPPFRQRIEGGVRQQLDPPPDSVPPPEIRPEGGDPLRLRLGQLSAPFSWSANPDGQVSLHVEDELEPWVAFPKPSARSATLGVWRDPSPAAWDEPHTLWVADDSERFPDRSALVINLLPVPLAVRGGGADELLPPGKTALRNIAAGEGNGIRLAFRRADGEWQELPPHLSESGEGMREWIVIFRADQPNPRHPVGRISLREAMPRNP